MSYKSYCCKIFCLSGHHFIILHEIRVACVITKILFGAASWLVGVFNGCSPWFFTAGTLHLASSGGTDIHPNYQLYDKANQYCNIQHF